MTDEHGGGNGRIESLTQDLGRAFESRRGFLKKGATASAVGLGLSAGTGSVAASDDGDSGNKYVDTLNFALTLERLEATFYERGLEKFSESEIEESEIGQQFGEKVQASIQESLATVRDHEQAHVDALVTTVNDLGGDPVGEGDVEFQFPLESPEGFIKTAQTLETTGVSAYTGAIDQLSGSDELLTAAATIATVEGRHSAYLNGLTGKSPFPRAFDEPKPPEEIMEAIQPFLASEE
jgi:hypothetical protein